QRRCIEVVAAVLARQAQALSVPEFRRAADRLVEHLDPPSPDGAHQRRYLHLARLPDGSLIGKFACGPAQALAFTAIITAGAAPRPGTGIDPDGIDHPLPDERTPAQRRMDALTDALHIANTANTPGDAGSATPGDGSSATPGSGGRDPSGDPADTVTDPADTVTDEREPPREGESRTRRRPGTRTGPYPTTEILLTLTLDQFAAALDLPPATTRGATGTDPPGPDPGAGHDPSAHAVGFARAQHGGPVHPRTLAMLTCSARLRAIVVDAHGAVLHLGRASRLASPAQRRALLARDIGCIIPGCAVPGEHCDIHHVTPWAAGGGTDVPNLVLLCPRHHSEIDIDDTWQIHMIDGVPWVRPPRWAHHDQPLLRNTTHQPHTGSAA
ncbi:MAG TPA: DUF222 domain-containing protein, partial [Kineosporiaceae bacterium]|nr:DUF222 domain-containing protein [Kineosporiaceae bacterium]